jgi:hypothetical protein
MASVILMGTPQDSIFGPLLQEQMQKSSHPLAAAWKVLQSHLHPLWEKITFVRPEIMLNLMDNFFRNHCGKEKVVWLGAHAVPYIPLHGSASNCCNPPVMTLRGCAQMIRELLKI